MDLLYVSEEDRLLALWLFYAGDYLFHDTVDVHKFINTVGERACREFSAGEYGKALFGFKLAFKFRAHLYPKERAEFDALYYDKVKLKIATCIYNVGVDEMVWLSEEQIDDAYFKLEDFVPEEYRKFMERLRDFVCRLHDRNQESGLSPLVIVERCSGPLKGRLKMEFEGEVRWREMKECLYYAHASRAVECAGVVHKLADVFGADQLALAEFAGDMQVFSDSLSSKLDRAEGHRRALCILLVVHSKNKASKQVQDLVFDAFAKYRMALREAGEPFSQITLKLPVESQNCAREYCNYSVNYEIWDSVLDKHWVDYVEYDEKKWFWGDLACWFSACLVGMTVARYKGERVDESRFDWILTTFKKLIHENKDVGKYGMWWRCRIVRLTYPRVENSMPSEDALLEFVKSLGNAVISSDFGYLFNNDSLKDGVGQRLKTLLLERKVFNDLLREYQVPLYENKLGIYEYNSMWDKADDKETVEYYARQPIIKYL
jgi:hypothetical protein